MKVKNIKKRKKKDGGKTYLRKTSLNKHDLETRQNIPSLLYEINKTTFKNLSGVE